MIDDDKINNIVKFCLKIKNYNNVFYNFKITSKCDPINSCQQCQNINNFIKQYGNKAVYLLSNNNIIKIPGIFTYTYSCYCDNYDYELFFHDPNKILLVYKNQPDENDYCPKYYNIIIRLEKYICLMDLIRHYIGISKETFKDSFSYNISMESSKKENNKFYHVKINTQH